MAHPTVQTFPVAPSRVGDPDNFYVESSAFLDAFLDYESESNAYKNYINSLPIDGWNWGSLTEINPTQPTITLMPPMPDSSDNGLQFTTKADDFLVALESFSYTQNLVGAYIDDLAAIGYTATFLSDANRPILSALTTAPARGQSQSVFENNSIAWGASIITYVINLNSFSNYYKGLLTDDDDFGLVTQTATVTIDYNA